MILGVFQIGCKNIRPGLRRDSSPKITSLLLEDDVVDCITNRTELIKRIGLYMRLISLLLIQSPRVGMLLAVFCMLLLPINAFQDDKEGTQTEMLTKLHGKKDLSPRKPGLNMTLCVDQCSLNCKSYLTPLSECYNSQILFPNDPSWSGYDVFDTVICQTLVRAIFKTSNGSCTASTSDDRFQIPMNECVGPFGKPRPWGMFSLFPGSAEQLDQLEEKDC